MFPARTIVPPILIALLVSAPLHAATLDEAVTLLEEGWQARAEKQLEELADRDPDDAEVWYRLAWARFYVNDFDEAEKYIDRAVERDPDNTDYLILQGHTVGRRAQTGSKLKAIGRAKKCRGLYERVLELEPDNVEAHLSLIQYLLQAPGIAGGDRERARQLADALVAIDPVEGAIMQGMVHEKDEDADGALAAYERAVDAARAPGQDRRRADWIFVNACYRFERPDRARAFFEATGDRMGLARHFAYVGDSEAARKIWQDVAAADSTRVPGLVGLARLDESLEDWPAAAALWDSVYAAAPDRHDLLYQSAKVRMLGDFELDVAAAGFRDYLGRELNRSWPSEGWARVRLAEVLWKAGDETEARRERDRAKKLSGRDERLKEQIEDLDDTMNAGWDDEEL